MAESGITQSLLEKELGCPYAPEICTHCTAMALGASHAGKLDQEHLDRDKCLLEMEFDPTKPMMELNMEAIRGEYAAAVYAVNDEFTETFGLTSDDVNAVVEWSGGSGMLPWGCDVFACVVAEESEILTMLQILAIKFNSQQRPNHDGPISKDVPFVTFTDVVLKDGRVCQALIRATFCEIIEATRIRLLGGVSFELKGQPRERCNGKAATPLASFGASPSSSVSSSSPAVAAAQAPSFSSSSAVATVCPVPPSQSSHGGAPSLDVGFQLDSLPDDAFFDWPLPDVPDGTTPGGTFMEDVDFMQKVLEWAE